MNPGVAVSRQSAAISRKCSQRRSAETPLQGHGSWRAGCPSWLYSGERGSKRSQPTPVATFGAKGYSAENLNTVVERNGWPGRRIGDGKSGLFTESG